MENKSFTFKKLNLPDSLQLQVISKDRFDIITEQSFEKGDILFKYTPLRIPSNSTIFIELNGSSVMLDSFYLPYNGYDPNYFQYGATIMKHSILPNVEIICSPETKEKLCVCLRDIQKGESLCIDKTGSTRIQSYMLTQQKMTDVLDIGTIVLPEGVTISSNKYGYCLKVTKSFKKGQTIFQNELIYVPTYINNFKFTIGSNQHKGDKTNSVLQGNKRIIYHYIGYMNHSCEENTNAITQQNGVILQVANRDIEAGEQITCNYLYFDQFCDGHQFKCQCGSLKCFGQIRGFENIGLEEQIRLLPNCIHQIKKSFFEKHTNLIQKLQNWKIPQNIEVKQQAGAIKLMSKKQYDKGDIIFKLKPILIDNGVILIYEKGKGYKRGSLSKKFKQDTSYIEFSPRKCEQSNCKVVNENGQLFGICIENIKPGQQLKSNH